MLLLQHAHAVIPRGGKAAGNIPGVFSARRAGQLCACAVCAERDISAQSLGSCRGCNGFGVLLC